MNIQAAIADMSEMIHMHVDTASLSQDKHSHSHTHETHEGDIHCQHCCHAHASTIMAHEIVIPNCLLVEPNFQQRISYSHPASGPPTPPPNA